jgi:RNA-directed DNA polymerase
MKGSFDPMDHDGRLAMRRLRLDDRAFLGLIRKWLKAGMLETAGRVIHPDTGVPPAETAQNDFGRREHLCKVSHG